MPAKASARKHSAPKAKRADRLDWEELEQAPNVDGMFSYLRVAEPQPSDTLPSHTPPSQTLAPERLRVHGQRIHRCHQIHDAHTPGEQLVLAALFVLGGDHGLAEPGGARIVSISLAQLAERISMHETNVRFNVRSLIGKLAMEVVELEDRKKQSARRYRVYSPEQILERRRRAGLEWVIKNRGVHFVDPGSGSVISQLPGSVSLAGSP